MIYNHQTRMDVLRWKLSYLSYSLGLSLPGVACMFGALVGIAVGLVLAHIWSAQ